MSDSAFEEIIAQIESFGTETNSLTELQELAVSLMSERLPHYNWVGFYMLDPSDAHTLVLGPFRGAPTEHIRIPIGEGICGAAVTQGDTIIVDDVCADPRYLACSIDTRSEIVVPIYVGGKIVGEIDIDSHSQRAFGPEDRAFLEKCAEVIGRYVETQPE